MSPTSLAGLRHFMEPGSVHEFRALKVVDNPKYRPYTVVGYFDYDHIDHMAASCREWTMMAEGIYISINPLIADMLALANNKVIRRAESAANAQHVIKRVGLVFDADPVRNPARVSSTKEEKTLAGKKITEVREYLTELGWPLPILADSGNGYHLRYHIDLPTDDGGLVERVLKAMDAKFSDDHVKIDPKLFDPPRISKLYGSKWPKGTTYLNDPIVGRRARNP